MKSSEKTGVAVRENPKGRGDISNLIVKHSGIEKLWLANRATVASNSSRKKYHFKLRISFCLPVYYLLQLIWVTGKSTIGWIQYSPVTTARQQFLLKRDSIGKKDLSYIRGRLLPSEERKLWMIQNVFKTDVSRCVTLQLPSAQLAVTGNGVAYRQMYGTWKAPAWKRNWSTVWGWKQML